MVSRKRAGTLTKDERKIVKARLDKKWRNQDIQAPMVDEIADDQKFAAVTAVKNCSLATGRVR